MKLQAMLKVTVAAAAFGLLAQVAVAQVNGTQAEPANLPPADFQGDSYVDNRGCIFLRAGFNGQTSWVPRVTRSREQVCGQEPTFAGAVAEAPARQTQPAAQAPAVAGGALSAPPAPVRTAGAGIAPDPFDKGGPGMTPAPSMPRAEAPPLQVRRVPVAHRQGVPLSIFPAPDYAALHGDKPRTAPPRATRAVGSGPVTGKTIIVPRHVWEHRDTQIPHIPYGYRPAWEDDRLNPYRAWQTIDGYLHTQEVWSNTVPRQAVSKVKRHTVEGPALAYRVTSKAPSALSGHGGQIIETSSGVFISTQGAAVAPRAPQQAPQASAAPRYVHVGAFTTAAKADAAAARLRAAGLPVRFGTHRRDGQDLRAVLVGPFATEDGMMSARARVQAIGY